MLHENVLINTNTEVRFDCCNKHNVKFDVLLPSLSDYTSSDLKNQCNAIDSHAMNL